jgi:hypothetical protein
MLKYVPFLRMLRNKGTPLNSISFKNILFGNMRTILFYSSPYPEM